MTQPGCLHLDEHFAPNRQGNVHILKVEPAAECVNDKRFHLRPPCSCLGPIWCRIWVNLTETV